MGPASDAFCLGKNAPFVYKGSMRREIYRPRGLVTSDVTRLHKPQDTTHFWTCWDVNGAGIQQGLNQFD